MFFIVLQETGIYIPQTNRYGGGPPPMNMNGSLGAPWKPGISTQGQGTGFGDFFGSMMGKC